LQVAERHHPRVWDTDGPGDVDLDGKFHSVHGAERGPAAAHEIPIWIGPTSRRCRTSWDARPTAGYRRCRSWSRTACQRNAINDEAARAANRDPREITRLLNIFPGQQTPETLTQLAVEDGVSIFILASDDPDVIERFAAETIPAVSEHIARQRT
jgi:hypothetical protein